MSGARWRRAVLAGTGAAAVALASVMSAAFAFGDQADVIMGGSGIPIPPPVYVDGVNDLYLHCAPPTCVLDPLATPEGLYPIIGGAKGLTFDESTAQGLQILNGEIGGELAKGNDVTVLGYSQSATIETFEMEKILSGSAGFNPTAEQLSFILLGDPNNPNGGLLERADLPLASSEPSIPSLGITFSGATPVTEYPTEIYTAEYDGFADFPKYPINLLSDLNALLGILFVHTQYPDITNLGDAVQVPTSLGYDGATTYWMIPTDDLPLLDLLRSVPVIGNPLSDLMEPDLRVLVNLGYGDPEYGWVNENADIPTPAGVFPSLADLEKVPALLLSGTEEGIQKFFSDLQDPSQLFSPANNPLLNLLETPYISAVASEDISFPAPDASLTGIVNAVSEAASNFYSALLSTADIANALLVTLPTENVTLFLEYAAQGDYLDAFGIPLAADTALVPLAGLFEIASVGESALIGALDLISPFVDVSSLIP